VAVVSLIIGLFSSSYFSAKLVERSFEEELSLSPLPPISGGIGRVPNKQICVPNLICIACHLNPICAAVTSCSKLICWEVDSKGTKV
jgi:hypothetical protein